MPYGSSHGNAFQSAGDREHSYEDRECFEDNNEEKGRRRWSGQRRPQGHRNRDIQCRKFGRQGNYL